MHPNSELLFRRHVLELIEPGCRVLEIAPDDAPSTFRRAVDTDVTWTTADLATEVSADRRLWGAGTVHLLMPSEHEIPAEDGSFDLVVSGQVIEHVRRPWVWVGELARVCRPGGRVVTINPVSWPYHEAPVDCWRIYPEGMRALSADAGLEVELSEWGSLEARPRRWYPGPSHNTDLGRRGVLLNRAKAIVGWPLPIAFDTVTVARKPE